MLSTHKARRSVNEQGTAYGHAKRKGVAAKEGSRHLAWMVKVEPGRQASG